MTYTIIEIEKDEDGFSTATLTPGGGVVTDHPYWEDKPDSHYLEGLTGKEIGDKIAV